MWIYMLIVIENGYYHCELYSIPFQVIFTSTPTNNVPILLHYQTNCKKETVML